MSDFVSFLARFRQQVEPLEIEMADAWWQANVSSSPEAETRAGTAQKALTRLYANPEDYALLKATDTAKLSADEQRQHTLLRNAFTGNQMDDAVIEQLVDTERRVETAYNSYRPLVAGTRRTDNEIRDILRTSADSGQRREAWEASKEIGQVVADDILTMVALRNREAQRLGFSNYFTMSLLLQEQEQDTLFLLLDDLHQASEPLWASYKGQLDRDLSARFGIPVAQLRPWHFSDPFFQEAPPGEVDFDRFYKGKDLEAIATAFFDAIGLEIRDILARSDLYERENKNQHAFCQHVGRFEDVRVLCNCTDSERWMGTILHEFGHAVYDKYLDPTLPFFLRQPAHILTTEAIAMLLGRLSRNSAFLEQYVGVAPQTAHSVAEAGKAEVRGQLLVFLRWVLVMTHFERAMYEGESLSGLNTLWWDLVERYQGVTRPEGRSRPDWAAKLHLALAPVYYHNYLLGEMMASQLTEYIGTQVLSADNAGRQFVSSPAVGAYLRNTIFASGGRFPWFTLIEKATGKPLTPHAFLTDLSQGSFGSPTSVKVA